MLEMVAKASDLSLLTMAELEDAVAGSGSTMSPLALGRLGEAVATQIAGLCNVAETDSGDPPTLRRETLRETIRTHGPMRHILLARRFVNVTSVTQDDVLLVAGTDYVVNASAGIISRPEPGYWLHSFRGTFVIEYTAGFATVPPDLAEIAAEMVRLRVAVRARDPLIRSKSTDGIDSTTYRDAAPAGSDFDMLFRQRLARFSSLRIA